MLRKNLIDLDYEHKIVFEQYKKKNQEIEKEKAEERHRRLEEDYKKLQDDRHREAL